MEIFVVPHIHKTGVRTKLEPRREPYWARIARGQYIGYRKLPEGGGTWIARRRGDDGRQSYKSLGFDTDAFGFDQAKLQAEHWFKLKEADIKDEVVTVSDACRRYVEERRTSKSEDCAHDADKRFERTIYGKRHPDTGEITTSENALGKRQLAKVRTAHIKAWRDGLGLSPAAANRTLTALKAALNLAVAERNVVASQAQEWAEVKPLPGGKSRRDLFLDLEQRRALLSQASAACRDLMEGVALTGIRPGKEITTLTRKKFDARTKSLTIVTGKTGGRTIPLSPAAVDLFTRLSKDKLPNAPLFTRDDGQPWAHSDYDELVREAARRAGLPSEPKTGVCLYTLRHCFITEALLAGMATLDVARLAGTSVMMIEKHYGHLVASAARERLAKVELL